MHAILFTQSTVRLTKRGSYNRRRAEPGETCKRDHGSIAQYLHLHKQGILLGMAHPNHTCCIHLQDYMTVEPGSCNIAHINRTTDFKRLVADFRVAIEGNVLLKFKDKVEVEAGKQSDSLLIPFVDLLRVAQVSQ